MEFVSRPYVDTNDLRKIQVATAHWIGAAGYAFYPHVEDIGWRLFNGMRRYPPQEIVGLWEDNNGNLLGWGMCYPRWKSYEVAVHPQYWATDLPVQIVDWSEQDLHRRLALEDPAYSINLSVYEGNLAFVRLLQQRGYRRGEQYHPIASRSLDEPIPDSRLLDGFSIRSVHGPSEAEQIVEAENSSFGWHWTAEDYRQVMQSPGYNPEHQLVVVAPDGRFAAFCTLLVDEMNKTVMFEDVDSHRDFQRRGLGLALLYDGMRCMKAQGITTAFVPHRPVEENEAAFALYAKAGFRHDYSLHDYEGRR